MGSTSQRRQTMAKLNRERAVKEKRALKQEKKAARQAAAAAPDGATTEKEVTSTDDDALPVGSSPEMSSAQSGPLPRI